MAKKDALRQFHKDTISAAANRLFMERDIEKTTMDDIAREAEYSKATLYAYFSSKDEILKYITLQGMKQLQEAYEQILTLDFGAIEKFMLICEKQIQFYQEHPVQFQNMLDTIATDEESRSESEILEETYQVGEKLNKAGEVLMQQGIKEGVFREDLPFIPIGLTYWASVFGILTLAEKKQEYISLRTGMSKEDFMNFSFKLILRTILKEGVTVD